MTASAETESLTDADGLSRTGRKHGTPRLRRSRSHQAGWCHATRRGRHRLYPLRSGSHEQLAPNPNEVKRRCHQVASSAEAVAHLDIQTSK